MGMIEVYSVADWEHGRHPWDDLIGGEKGSIYLTICGMANLLQDLKVEQSLEEPTDLHRFEDILFSLEGGSIQVVLSDYDDDLLHDIYIPEYFLNRDLVRYHLDVFNSTHPKLPDFEFIDEVPPFWGGEKRIRHI